MAIYYLEVKIGSKGKGQSAIASSAYRSGTKLIDEVTGKVFDYTRKTGVVHSEISLCDNAPEEYANRENLWNAVHKIEKASNAQIFREIIVAIPKELNQEEQIKLLRDYVKGFTERGMCVDWNIHDKGDGNPHAHIMLTMRSILKDGTWAAKSRKVYDLNEKGNKIFQKVDKTGRKQYKSHKADYNDWNQKERVEEWRAEWAACCNQYLSSENQIDHRSYERQGLEIIPQIHEGYASRKREQRGLISDRCEYNRQVKADNQQIRVINLTIQANQKEMTKMKSTNEYDIQQLILLRDEYVRQVYISNHVKYNHFKDNEHENLKNAQKHWKEFQECVKAVQQANQEFEKIFSITSKKKRQQQKENAIEQLQQAKRSLQNYVHIEIGHEHWLIDFKCDAPKDSDLELISKYVEKAIEYQKNRVVEERKANERLQTYIDMHVTSESIIKAYKAFTDACQAVPESRRLEAAQVLADNKIPMYLDNASYFPKIVPIIREKISQVLKKYHLDISDTSTDPPENMKSQVQVPCKQFDEKEQPTYDTKKKKFSIER